MNKVLNPIKLSILLVSVLAGFLTSGCGGDYYSGCDNKSGEELLNVLHNKISHKDFYGYASLANQYKTTDNDPNIDGNVILFYSGKSYEWFPWGKCVASDQGIEGVQREHVWPQSRFRKIGDSRIDEGIYYLDNNPTPYNDLHNVRPAWSTDNSSHSNEFYGEADYLFDPQRDTEHPDTEHSYRGDIARIIFYCATRFTELEIIDDDGAGTQIEGGSYQIGKLSDLIKWNLENPVSQRELQRNEAIYKGRQGNRNPYIDHPEYVCKIWGPRNQETRRICGL